MTEISPNNLFSSCNPPPNKIKQNLRGLILPLNKRVKQVLLLFWRYDFLLTNVSLFIYVYVGKYCVF